jgi:hypothetical protein
MGKGKSIRLLEAVKLQVEAEIATDMADIEQILDDPSIVPHDIKKGIAYSLHDKYHHLTLHIHMLNLIENDLKTLNER